jgi:hypothetical protein
MTLTHLFRAHAIAEELIDAINRDVEYAKARLAEPKYAAFANDPFLANESAANGSK